MRCWRKAGVTLTSLDAIAFGRGPGGFTGVRLAASVAQGLAFGAGIGVVPISDLAAVAAAGVPARSGSAARARRQRCAHARGLLGVASSSRRSLAPAGAERVSAAVDVTLPAGRRSPGSRPDAGLRPGPELAERCRAAGAALYPDLLPRASEILALARTAVAAGQILDPADALPVYVRDHVAEVLNVIKVQ